MRKKQAENNMTKKRIQWNISRVSQVSKIGSLHLLLSFPGEAFFKFLFRLFVCETCVRFFQNVYPITTSENISDVFYTTTN